jgi:hypothetical protein
MNATATIAPGPQHLQALSRANEVRLARADLKRRVATGEISAGDVILESPWEARSMSVSETKTIGSLTERQRLALAALLGVGPSPRGLGRIGRIA